MSHWQLWGSVTLQRCSVELGIITLWIFYFLQPVSCFFLPEMTIRLSLMCFNSQVSAKSLFQEPLLEALESGASCPANINSTAIMTLQLVVVPLLNDPCEVWEVVQSWQKLTSVSGKRARWPLSLIGNCSFDSTNGIAWNFRGSQKLQMATQMDAQLSAQMSLWWAHVRHGMMSSKQVNGRTIEPYETDRFLGVVVKWEFLGNICWLRMKSFWEIWNHFMSREWMNEKNEWLY